MLYQTATLPGLKILTHNATPFYQKNGLSQVGNVRDPFNGLSGPSPRFWGPVGTVRLPRRSGMSDAYINDNPYYTNLRGLADDPVDGPNATAEQIASNGTPSFWGNIGTDISNLFGNVFTTAANTTETSAQTAITNAISGSINPVSQPANPIAVRAPSTGTIAGVSTLTLAAAGVAAFLLLRKK